jgi:ATP-dependent Lon protease
MSRCGCDSSSDGRRRRSRSSSSRRRSPRRCATASDSQQREFLLRRQLEAIRKELGDDGDERSLGTASASAIDALERTARPRRREGARKELRFEKTPPQAPSGAGSKLGSTRCCRPVDGASVDVLDVDAAAATLDADHTASTR